MKFLLSENTPCNFNGLILASKCKKSAPPNKWREIAITENSTNLGRFIWDPNSESFVKWDILTDQLTRLERIYQNSTGKVNWKLIGPDLNLSLNVNARYPQMIEAAKASSNLKTMRYKL